MEETRNTKGVPEASPFKVQGLTPQNFLVVLLIKDKSGEGIDALVVLAPVVSYRNMGIDPLGDEVMDELTGRVPLVGAHRPGSQLEPPLGSENLSEGRLTFGGKIGLAYLGPEDNARSTIDDIGGGVGKLCAGSGCLPGETGIGIGLRSMGAV